MRATEEDSLQCELQEVRGEERIEDVRLRAELEENGFAIVHDNNY